MERGWLPLPARSRAATGSFFLSEHGDRDAAAELRATLEGLFLPAGSVPDEEHPQCRFIARRHWLAARLAIDPGELPAVECVDYERWREGLAATGLTLIFPEGFMHSAASMFGHTLLRIDSSDPGGAGALLGYGVDFTADSGGDNTFSYLAKGVAGGYSGRFSVRPYTALLKRYADWDNRDVWEYELDVSDDQLDLLLEHLWELRGIEFPYYFFTKNCSYELLRLLDVGLPDLDAADDFRGPVIPIDTVRATIAPPGLLVEARYRPSPETRLREALRSLPRSDRELVRRIAAGKLPPEDPTLAEIGTFRSARVLDVAYDQLRYEFLAGQVSEADSRALSRRILLARSRIAVDSAAEARPPEPGTRPDLGHDSSLVALGAGWRDDESFLELRWQPAFHDLIAPSGGFPEHMEIRFLDTRLRVYPESGDVRLHELSLVQSSSLSPRSRIFRPLAWSFGTGLRTRRVPDNDGLDDASVWGTRIGAGAAIDPTRSLLLYALADARADVGPDLDGSAALGLGARGGAYFGTGESRWKGHLFGEVTRYVAGDTTTESRAGIEARWSLSRNFALVLDGTFNRIHDESWGEGALRFHVYY